MLNFAVDDQVAESLKWQSSWIIIMIEASDIFLTNTCYVPLIECMFSCSPMLTVAELWLVIGSLVQIITCSLMGHGGFDSLKWWWMEVNFCISRQLCTWWNLSINADFQLQIIMFASWSWNQWRTSRKYAYRYRKLDPPLHNWNLFSLCVCVFSQPLLLVPLVPVTFFSFPFPLQLW
jgi:hypothetical protein